jgi:hypothetical protein
VILVVCSGVTGFVSLLATSGGKPERPRAQGKADEPPAGKVRNDFPRAQPKKETPRQEPPAELLSRDEVRGLVGKSRAEVKRKLGEPVRTSRDGNHEKWRYEAITRGEGAELPDCVTMLRFDLSTGRLADVAFLLAEGDTDGSAPASDDGGKRDGPKQQAQPKQQQQEDLDAPLVEEVFYFDLSRLAVGQAGEFRPRSRYEAERATVVAVLSPTSMVIETGGRRFVLSGDPTQKHESGKTVYLRGEWEVVGRQTFRGGQLWEFARR